MTGTLLRPTQGSAPQTGFYRSDSALSRTGLGRGEEVVRGENDRPSVWKFDSVAVSSEYRDHRNDGNGLIPPYKLTQVIDRVFEQRFSPYKAIEMFPVNRDGDWEDYIEHYAMSKTGRAAQICCANDFPRVNISGRSFKTPTITIGTGYEVCYSDMKKAEKAGFGYVERLTNAAKQIIEETLNKYAFQGDSRAGILGLANNPMLGVQAAPIRLDDTAADPLLVTQILQRAMRSGYVASGMANPLPDTMAIAPSLLQSFAARPLSMINPMFKVLDDIKNAGIIKNIVEAPELESAGPNGTRATVFYKADRNSVEWRVPGSVEVLPPFWNGYGYEVNIIARVNSLWFYYPQEVVKLIG